MKGLYEVTATKTCRVKGVNGHFTADDDYVVYKGYQVARSESEAIELAKYYIVNPYHQLRASFLREAD